MPREDKVAAVIEAFAGRRRQPYSWLWHHYPELSSARKAGKRTDWKQVAEAMAAIGVKPKNGDEFKSETLRKTWQRLEADVARHGHSPTPPVRKSQETVPRPVEPGLRPGEVAPGVRPIQQERSGGGTGTDFSPEPDRPQRKKFRSTATFRGAEEVNGEGS